MCRVNQQNFFHYCTHRQIVDVPSVNPLCHRTVYAVSYRMNEWCPRCRWTGFLVPYEYTESGPGIRCAKRPQAPTDSVTRSITLPRSDYAHVDKLTRWERRQDFLTGPLWYFRHQQRELQFEHVRRQEVKQGVTALRERTYFMLEEILDAPHDYNRCGDLFWPVWPETIPEGQELCAICRGDMCRKYDDEARNCESKTFCILPCDHYYGIYCISKWIAGGGTSCPECRQEYKIMRQLEEAKELTRVPTGYNEQQIVDLHLIPYPDLDALGAELPEPEVVRRIEYGTDEDYQQAVQLSMQRAQEERHRVQEAKDLAYYDREYFQSLESLHYSLVQTLMQKLFIVGVMFAPFPFLSWTNIWMLTCAPLLFYSSGIHLPMVLPRAPYERRTMNKFALWSALGNTLEVIYANVARGAGYPWWRLLLGIVGLPAGYWAYKRFYALPIDFPWTEEAIEREVRAATLRNRIDTMINTFEGEYVKGNILTTEWVGEITPERMRILMGRRR